VQSVDVRLKGRRTIGALAMVVLAAVGATRCGETPREPLRLEGNRLTVDNQSSQDWHDVEIYLNTYYRVTTSTIRARSVFQAPLDVFVAGFGQRFDLRRMPIHSLKLTAKLPDDQPMELNKKFQLSGLPGALGGKQ
jgi:hypothetical protein